MKGLVTGYGEIENERNSQVFMEKAVTYIEGSTGYFTDILDWKDWILFILEGLVVPIFLFKKKGNLLLMIFKNYFYFSIIANVTRKSPIYINL
jgi:hypothetical protein